MKRRLASGLLSQSFQRTDEFLVVAPARQRTFVDLLPHLPGAGSDHLPLRGMEVQALWVPFETDKLQHFPRPGLLIGHQSLVGHVKNEPRRQYRAPMRHYSQVFAVVVGEVRQIEGKVEARQEMLEIARKAGIDGI